jgi:uncharacterized membrane protein
LSTIFYSFLLCILILQSKVFQFFFSPLFFYNSLPFSSNIYIMKFLLIGGIILSIILTVLYFKYINVNLGETQGESSWEKDAKIYLKEKWGPGEIKWDKIKKLVDDVHKRMLKIDAKFGEGKVENLEEQLNNVKRDILRLQIYFSHIEAQPEKLKQIPTQDWDQYTHRIESIGKNRKLFHEYKEEVINNEFKSSIGLVALINAIFLPLGVIVGYFGMNFKSMGSPTNNKGILSSKYGQEIVWVLMIGSIIIFSLGLSSIYQINIQNV